MIKIDYIRDYTRQYIMCVLWTDGVCKGFLIYHHPKGNDEMESIVIPTNADGGFEIPADISTEWPTIPHIISSYLHDHQMDINTILNTETGIVAEFLPDYLEYEILHTTYEETPPNTPTQHKMLEIFESPDPVRDFFERHLSESSYSYNSSPEYATQYQRYPLSEWHGASLPPSGELGYEPLPRAPLFEDSTP